MPTRSYRIRDVNRAVQSKLQLTLRSGRELNGYYELDGKKLFRVTLMHEYAGQEYRIGTLKKIRESLHLLPEDFDLLVRCPMSGADYAAYIRAKVERGEL